MLELFMLLGVIKLLGGRPGGGKSYTAARIIKGALASGQVVGTNLPIHREEMMRQLLADGFIVPDDRLVLLDRLQAKRFWEFVPQGESGVPTLVVIDEAHHVFSCDHNDHEAKQAYLFLAEARHYHYDAILMSQRPKRINAGIRGLVSEKIWVRDMRGAKIPELGIRWPFPNQILTLVIDYDPDKDEELGEIDRRYDVWDSSVWKLYDSYSHTQGVWNQPIEAVRERVRRKTEDVMTKGERMGVGSGFALVCLLLIVAIWRGGSVRVVKEVRVETSNAAVAGGSAPAPQVFAETKRQTTGLVFNAFGPSISGRGFDFVDTSRGRLRVGDQSPWGMVLQVTRSYVVCRAGDTYTQIVREYPAGVESNAAPWNALSASGFKYDPRPEGKVVNVESPPAAPVEKVEAPEPERMKLKGSLMASSSMDS